MQSESAKMKIGFFGNTNNYPFMLVRAFRRMGHSVTSIISRPENLHRPEFRYSDIPVPYPKWIHDIPLNRERDFARPNRLRSKVVSLLKNCDFVILNDLGISLAHLIQKPHIAFLTGSDLNQYCDPLGRREVLSAMTTRNPLKHIWARYQWSYLFRKQREGIRTAKLVRHFPRHLLPNCDVLLDAIGVPDEKRIFRLMADTLDIQYLPPSFDGPLRIFCATRLNWKSTIAIDSHLDNKRSDIMIRGIAKFVRDHDVKFEIHLVRKGRDVEATQQLVDEEGLAAMVTWHNEMTQAEVWEQYRLSNIVFEQFGNGIVTMAGLEAMATGRPVIGNNRPEIMEPIFGPGCPVCQAVSVDDIQHHLRTLVFDREHLEKVGQQSRKWIEDHHAPEGFAAEILQKMGYEGAPMGPPSEQYE